MRQVLFVTAAFVCLVIVAGQVPATSNPEPCCSPEQYEVQAALSVFQADGGTMNIDMPRVSMDFTRNMSSIVEEVPGIGTITSIMDYSKRLIYVIMHEDGQLVCLKNELPLMNIATQCLPKNTKFMGTKRMGSGNQILDCNTWLMERNLENPSTHIQAYLVTQSDGCVPVAEQVTVKTSNMTVSEGTLYYNFTPGIKDPSVFTIPAICYKSKVPDMSGLPNAANSVNGKFRKNK